MSSRPHPKSPRTPVLQPADHARARRIAGGVGLSGARARPDQQQAHIGMNHQGRRRSRLADVADDSAVDRGGDVGAAATSALLSRDGYRRRVPRAQHAERHLGASAQAVATVTAALPPSPSFSSPAREIVGGRQAHAGTTRTGRASPRWPRRRTALREGQARPRSIARSPVSTAQCAAGSASTVRRPLDGGDEAGLVREQHGVLAGEHHLAGDADAPHSRSTPGPGRVSTTSRTPAICRSAVRDLRHIGRAAQNTATCGPASMVAQAPMPSARSCRTRSSSVERRRLPEERRADRSSSPSRASSGTSARRCCPSRSRSRASTAPRRLSRSCRRRRTHASK